MPEFFKSKQIYEVIQLRPGAGYRILRTGDNEVTHCEVYCAGGMLRQVSDGKPVEMQFTDDEQILTGISFSSWKQRYRGHPAPDGLLLLRSEPREADYRHVLPQA